MTWSIEFAPLLPWWLLLACGGVALMAVAAAVRLRLRGWPLRMATAMVLLAALAGPALQQSEVERLRDVVFLARDASASQALGARAARRDTAMAALSERLDDLGYEVEPVDLQGDPEQGTRVANALQQAAHKFARDRIAGAIVLSDGQATAEAGFDLPGPVHLLATSEDSEFDRRLHVIDAPAYGIVGEQVEIVLEVTERGAFPGAGGEVEVAVSLDAGAEQRFSIPVGTEATLKLTLDHAGANMLLLSVPEAAGEITARNNAAVVTVNGVRDRLRALLVSGEPYAGERTWRNLLKSDPSLDLVHFTILRSADKVDDVPVFELSLIAFPTRELFLEKIDDFDLIIFDRYPRRGILSDEYLQNVANYVRRGGALLVAAGPHFATAESLGFSPLQQVLPGMPAGRVFEVGYRPRVSDLGQRHPVTRDLPGGGAESWGRWFRQVQLDVPRGAVLMLGADGAPLLVTDRIGAGRVALLASDNSWLWARGVEGGGPQEELLRRLSHWLMKQPDLEEESLSAEVNGATVSLTRHSLEELPKQVEIRAPSGETAVLPMAETAPGVAFGRFEAEETGLYHFTDGAVSAVAAVGLGIDREFDDPIGVYPELAAAVKASGGGIYPADDLPDIRAVRPGRTAAGRDWLGLPRRDAVRVLDTYRRPLLPAWAVLLLIAALSLLGWRREAR